MRIERAVLLNPAKKRRWQAAKRYRVIVENSKPNKKIVSREKNKLLKLVIYASFNDLLCIFAQWKIIQAEKNT